MCVNHANREVKLFAKTSNDVLLFIVCKNVDLLVLFFSSSSNRALSSVSILFVAVSVRSDAVFLEFP